MTQVEDAPAAYEAPLPRPTPESEPFWEACTQHVLQMQRCLACGTVRFPPGNRCPACLSAEAAWQPVCGRGTVYAFTVLRRAYHRGFADRLPYTVAVIALEEGPRLISNVVECDPGAVRVGMPVEVVFDDVAPEVALPRFRPRA